MGIFKVVLLAATTTALIMPTGGALAAPTPTLLPSPAAGVAAPLGINLSNGAPPQGSWPVRIDGERLFEQSAKVIRVLDGDTVIVRIDGESRLMEVRNAGIQALEKRQCHYVSAERGLKRVLRKAKNRVLLRSYYDSRNKGRLVRGLFLPNGKDVQAIMIRKGLVLPYALGDELFRQVEYAKLGQEAALRGKGLFDTDKCGVGPSQDADLQVMANYDADGSDKGYADKFLIVRNRGQVAADIGGWKIRSATKRFLEFPRGTVVNPGRSVKVELRPGTNTSEVFHWASGAKLFPNPGNSKKYKGGGVYLFDSDWDLRAWSVYPCQVNCGHPAAGKVGISVDWKDYKNPNNEIVTFQNSTGAPLDLSFLVAEIRYAIYIFPQGTSLNSGETLTMRMGRGDDTRTVKYLANKSAYARNSTNFLPRNGWVILRTHDSERIACAAWGDVRCSQRP